MSCHTWGVRDYEVITTEGMTEVKERRSLHRTLVHQKARLLHKFETAFHSFGLFIFDHAYAFIGSSLLAVALMSIALFYIRFEMRADMLYALPASQARSDLAKLVSLYGTPPRVNMVFVVHKDGEYVLTPEVLKKIKHLDEYIQRDLTVAPLRNAAASSMPVTYETICHRMDLPEVDFSSVDDLEWDFTRRQLLPDNRTVSSEGVTPCHAISPIDLYRNERQFGVPLATRNWPYVPNIAKNKIVKGDLILTDPLISTLSSGTTRLLNATGFLLIYHTMSDKRALAASLEWEGALVNFINHEIKPHASAKLIDPSRFHQLRKEKENYESTHLTFEERKTLDPSVVKFDDDEWSEFQVFVNAQRSWQDELGRSTSMDARLMRDYCLAYLIIACYMITVNRTNNVVRSKSICGWIGSLSALFGFCIGGGFCYWLGLRHTPTMHASPFLVLAIGLDNTFVVLNFYTLAHSYKDQPRERCAMSLSNAGISITITTFTSIISFLVGATGPYLAVRNFCYVTAMGLLGGYIMNIVFFFPFLCLESVGESRGQPFFLPVPAWIPLNFLHVKATDFDNQTVCGSFQPHDSLPTTEDCTRPGGDPFGGRNIKSLHNPGDIQMSHTVPFQPIGLTPPTSPGDQMAGTHVGSARLHRLYRHRQIMAGFKTGSSDVFTSNTTNSHQSSGHHSSNPPFSQPCSIETSQLEPARSTTDSLMDSHMDSHMISLFQNEFLNGRSIFELASIRWKYSRRHFLIRKEMVRRRLLDPKTKSVKLRAQLSQDALCEIDQKGHTHVLYTEPSTIPDVVLPSIYCVAKFAAEQADEPKGTVGKVSRGVFLNILGPALCRRRIQLLMMLTLLGYVGVSIFGAVKYLSAGLDLENLTPPDSYLREAFQLSHDKFPIFPYETNLFFTAPDVAVLENAPISEKRDLLKRYSSNKYGTRRPSDLKPLSADSLEAHEGNTAGMAEQMSPFWDSLGEVQWWEPQSAISYLEIDKRLRQMKTTQDVLNGMLLFYNENAQRLFGNSTLPAEERRFLFHAALYRWLKSGVVGQHVRDQFRFTDPDPSDPMRLPRLRGVRLIIFNYNFLNSFEQSKYMVEIRQACQDVSVNWSKLILNGTDIPRQLQTYVHQSTLQSKKQISDPIFNLPKAPAPSYPVINNNMEDHSKLPAGFSATPFMETFLFFESDISILKSTIVNMSTAFVAIVLVSSLLMRGVGTAALVTMMICLVDLGIVGFMGIWSIHLNILSMILLVLSIGFSVDYTVHVCHTFTHCLGKTRRDKMVETLILMCNPVTHGAISTFLGILPIAFRREFVMETFYKMTLLVVTFGFLNGVVFLPVVLAIKGPVFNTTKKASNKLANDIEEFTKLLLHPKNRKNSLS